MSEQKEVFDISLENDKVNSQMFNPQIDLPKGRYKSKNKGSRNGNWKGGTSKYPNNSLMKKNRLIILLNNPKCERCGGKATQVHHKDFSKNNHSLSNLIPVCNRCNVLLSNKYYQQYGMTLKEISKKINKSIFYCSVLYQEGILNKYL